MKFEVIGEIESIEIIARHRGIRDLSRLQRIYGKTARWTKRKGIARIERRPSGERRLAEIHWYEAHGMGRVEFAVLSQSETLP